MCSGSCDITFQNMTTWQCSLRVIWHWHCILGYILPEVLLSNPLERQDWGQNTTLGWEQHHDLHTHLQGAHGESGDGLALGHHTWVPWVTRVTQAVGNLWLVGDVLWSQLLLLLDHGGTLHLTARHGHRLPRGTLDHEAGVGGHAEVDEPCLRHLVNVDAVFALIFGFGPQGGRVGGQDHVAGVQGLLLSPRQLRVQLLEDVPVADVDGFRRLVLVLLQGEGVVAELVQVDGPQVVWGALKVHLGDVGWKTVEVGWAFLVVEFQFLLVGQRWALQGPRDGRGSARGDVFVQHWGDREVSSAPHLGFCWHIKTPPTVTPCQHLSQRGTTVFKTLFVFFKIQDTEGKIKAREEKNFVILGEFSVMWVFQHSHGQNSHLGQHVDNNTLKTKEIFRYFKHLLYACIYEIYTLLACRVGFFKIKGYFHVKRLFWFRK